MGVSDALNGKVAICATGVPVRVAEGGSVEVVVAGIRHVAVRIHNYALPVSP